MAGLLERSSLSLASCRCITFGLPDMPLEIKRRLLQQDFDFAMFVFKNSELTSSEGIGRSFGLDLINYPVILKLQGH